MVARIVLITAVGALLRGCTVAESGEGNGDAGLAPAGSGGGGQAGGDAAEGNDGGTEGDGRADGNGSTEGSGEAGQDTVELAVPPGPDPAAVRAEGKPLTLAVRRFLLGEVDWDGEYAADAWESYSYDLDGFATTESVLRDNLEQCSGSGTFYLRDGAGGKDNGFARNFLSVLHNFTESREVSGYTNEAVAAGELTLLLHIEDLAASGSQAGVTISAYQGARRDTAPRFDGNDVWPVSGASVRQGDIASAVVRYAEGYVTDDVLVAQGRPSLYLELSLRGYRLPLVVHESTIVLEVAQLRAGELTARGTITGALDVEETSESVQLLGLQAFRTCDQEAVRAVSGGVAGSADIMRDLQKGDYATRCNAISVGIGFESTVAHLGEVLPAAEPEPVPCADGEAVSGEGALAGSCDSVPPIELAVTCSVVERTSQTLATHRVAAEQCQRERPRGPVCPGSFAGGADYDRTRLECLCHEECTEGENGRCYVYGYNCSYDECFADDDCGPGRLCMCGYGEDGNHVCVQASCRTDADCTGGQLCSPTVTASCPNLSPVVGYYCHTDEDECRTDADCALDTADSYCIFDGDLAHWRCSRERCTTP